MRILARTLAVAGAVAIGAAAAVAQPADGADLTGRWSGEALFRLPDGEVLQTHLFVFEAGSERFLTGEHMWDIPDRSMTSHDGREHTYTAAEPFLGVIDGAGEIWLVEHGDHTIFRLRLVDPDTLEFIALEGGGNPLVGIGTLVRE